MWLISGGVDYVSCYNHRLFRSLLQESKMSHPLTPRCSSGLGDMDIVHLREDINIKYCLEPEIIAYNPVRSGMQFLSRYTTR